MIANLGPASVERTLPDRLDTSALWPYTIWPGCSSAPPLHAWPPSTLPAPAVTLFSWAPASSREWCCCEFRPRTSSCRQLLWPASGACPPLRCVGSTHLDRMWGRSAGCGGVGEGQPLALLYADSPFPSLFGFGRSCRCLVLPDLHPAWPGRCAGSMRRKAVHGGPSGTVLPLGRFLGCPCHVIVVYVEPALTEWAMPVACAVLRVSWTGAPTVCTPDANALLRRPSAWPLVHSALCSLMCAFPSTGGLFRHPQGQLTAST